MTETIDEALGVWIEGLPYIWVTDHTGDVLLGSGPNSWIGQYEQDAAYTAHETVGQRTVLGGLKMPQRIDRGRIDPKTGRLDSTLLTLEIIDEADVFPTLFATEGKDFNILGARVAPGTTALGPLVTVEGSQTLNPTERYFGIERLGPARERAWFFPFPFQGIGHHHQVHGSAQSSQNGPPPIKISADPITFTGRKVVVYRLRRNNADRTASVADWPHWGDQYDLGPPEFVGVMRDVGRYAGDRTWRIECFGQESLLRRKMGTYDDGWTHIDSVPIALTDEQIGISVLWHTYAVGGAQATYGSTVFGTDTVPPAGTKADYIASINTIVDEVATGATAADFGTSGDMYDEDFTTNDSITFVIGDADVKIKRPAGGTAAILACSIAMHERTWRVLGYEPALQSISWSDAPSSEADIVFQPLEPGQQFGPLDANNTIPGPGYWYATFNTCALDFAPQGAPAEAMDNEGAPRRYKPMFALEPIVLPSPANGQTFQVGGFPYVEPDPTVDAGSDNGRFFMFRGKRAVGDVSETGHIIDANGNLADEVEAEPFAAVAEVRWSTAGTYGSIDADPFPEFSIYRWADSRRFGADHDQIQDAGEWSALSAGEYAIECVPLHAYAYRETAGGAELDRAWAVFGQLLLSTGTASGWSAGQYSDGLNAPTVSDATFWCNDIASSELGLGIPYQLVDTPAEIRSVFAEVEGGAHGELQKVRYCYSEPFQAQDLLDSILRTRGLSMSLRGGRFGVVKLGMFDPEDVDFVLNEQSIALRDPEDPSSDPTTSRPHGTGAVDVIGIKANVDPSTGEPVYEASFPARDQGARFRRGDIEEMIEDPGLRGTTWVGPFKQTHAVDRAEWLAKGHKVVSTTLNRIAGESIWPGARVSFSHERLYAADGTLGLTNAFGHVLSCTPRPRRNEYEVEILIYADQLRIPTCAPIGKIASIDGDEITLVPDADFLDHGADSDAERFDRPSWMGAGTAARVILLMYDRVSWTLLTASTALVASASGNVVTLAAPFAGAALHANRDYYLILAPHDDQNVGSWPTLTCLPYVDDTLQFGSGSTPGWPYFEG